ncbi:MAG: helix-turn-helix transcriptional regulator [Rhizobiales bacterium]|nr:helix-turn-helix transcriptional regulator [Hyphomicrobiales bacterium]
MDNFKNRLKLVIKNAGGNKTIAEKSGVNLRTLNTYINGNAEPSVSKLKSIAQTCNVSLDWLVFGGDENELSIHSFNPINEEAVYLSLDVIEHALEVSNRIISTKDKAELLVSVYKIYDKSKNSVQTTDIKEIIKLVG